MRICVIILAVLAAPVWADPVPGAAEALNSLRANAGLAAVAPSAPLQRMAEEHAQDMARRGYFSHTGADGSDIAQRAERVGYGYCALAENIAQGQASLSAVMAGWADSRGHRRNMLNPEVREFALARAPGNLWVMVLGRPGC